MAEPLSIAFYCTGHGLGHATRVVEICKHLVERGHSVTAVTAAPARFFTDAIPPTRFQLRKATLDCGSKQLDAFTVDMKGSLEEYHALCVEHRDELLAGEVAWLKANRIDLVASDVVPIVCTAAAKVGIPAVCISNFTWGAWTRAAHAAAGAGGSGDQGPGGDGAHAAAAGARGALRASTRLPLPNT